MPDTPLQREAREAFEARRWQAHRPQPPVETVRPIEVLAFLIALVGIWLGVCLFLSTGSYPA